MAVSCHECSGTACEHGAHANASLDARPMRNGSFSHQVSNPLSHSNKCLEIINKVSQGSRALTTATATTLHVRHAFLYILLSSLHDCDVKMQHSVAMLEQCCNYLKQCRNNVATLFYAKNRRCESSRYGECKQATTNFSFSF